MRTLSIQLSQLSKQHSMVGKSALHRQRQAEQLEFQLVLTSVVT